jgi:hypothetical protein
VAAAFYPFGSVVLIDQISLTGADFSSLSLYLNLRHRWLKCKILINAGREGIIFRVNIKGFLDLNHTPHHHPTLHLQCLQITVLDPFSPHHNPNPQPITLPTPRLQPLVVGENMPTDNQLLSSNMLYLSPNPTSPYHSPSTLQVTVVEHKSIANYVMLARNKGKAKLIDPPSPGLMHSVQQSNSLPSAPLLLEPE